MSSIDYSEKIPNNVNLGEDRTLQRALEQWQPNFLSWWDDMGPEGSTELRRLPAHRGQRRPAGLGPVRPREDARLPLGHLPQPGQTPTARSTSATTRARRPGRTCPASTAPTCAASSSRRATPSRPRSSSSATSGLTAPSHVRPAQPVPGQRRGRPPPVGDGLPAAQATSAATAARKAKRCSSAAAASEDNPRILQALQRADARLAGVLHVHLLHRPRRQVPAVRAGREQLRSAGAHDASSC